MSGWGTEKEFAGFDAENRFDVSNIQTKEFPSASPDKYYRAKRNPSIARRLARSARPKRRRGADGLQRGRLQRLLSLRQEMIGYNYHDANT